MRRAQPLLVIVAMSVAGLSAVVPAQAARPIARFTAFAVDMSNMARRVRTGTIDVVVNRWSTDQERDRLLAALREKGSDGLLSELQKIKDDVGYVQTPGNVGYPLRYAREIPSGDGRRIIIATDRPISFLEAVNQPMTTDYPFMVIDMRLNAKGEGDGKLMPVAKITANEEHGVDIENWASEPVRLTSIKEVKP